MLIIVWLLILAAQAPRTNEPVRQGAPPAATMDDRRTDAIRAANARYRDAWLANDSRQVMATLAPGATILPNGLAPITGEAAIRAFWFPPNGPATTVTAMETPIDELTGNGDLAVVRGTGTLSFTLRYPDGREQSATQRSWYVTVLRRQPDGRWLITLRAWSDLRPKAP